MDSYKPKPLLNKSQLKQIKRSRTRVEGKKVITDDVKKLKSLSVTLDLPSNELENYYKEPIWIEYYIPRESRFAYEIKYLFIRLIDVEPRKAPLDEILREAQRKDSLIDLLEVIRTRPELEARIRNSYVNTMHFFDSISAGYKQFLETKDPHNLRIPLYHTETLMKREPTIASLEILGSFCLHNLNWMVRRLNRGQAEFSLEDETISILIKRRNEYWEKNNLPVDEDFNLFAALFYEQAFPNRGLEEMDSDTDIRHEW
ncbi:hypothetical protein CH373_10990 [Leptospira perolatii]|uniref:Uncharacterized protein n=1 Tax=Leptospira perolatii TaxID=2023191 RepID=A0A2M9ZLQ5_9LEPT|nr:hypothetical protein [Leptospira perolatii]PJZ69765.1 hypothetical protein CH360_09245 [Leptospira perolatii]PJZ73020.1 hypothetical protein CH373_10990 [Leptospira perolatii]